MRRAPTTLPDACNHHRLTHPRRDSGERAVTILVALVLTASVSLASLVASASDDDPIRKKARSRLQVSRFAHIDIPSKWNHC